MNTPLINGLKKYINENNIRFHMPGHKGKKVLSELYDMIPSIDVTEVRGTDNLHNPRSIILKSQNLASRIFKTKKTFYSVNGTTAGIYSAINSVLYPKEKILIQRNCHKSVYNAVILGQLEAEYIYPDYDSEKNIELGLNPNVIEEKLKEDKDIKAVVITYPSYYGVCSDIDSIVNVVHKHNRVLIVDEAHGSHLIFNQKLPKSSIEAGADIVVQSTHKTLPAFTQSSMIHVVTDRIDISRLKKMLAIHQSTSPSYLLMASIDLAIGYMDEYGAGKLNDLLDYIKEASTYLNNIDGINIVGREYINKKNYDFDTTKFLINIKGIKGSVIERILRAKHNIQLEMSDYYYGLALMTLLDDKEDIEKLIYALEDINNNKYIEEEILDINIKNIKPNIKMPIYNAFYSDKRNMALNESKGKVSGSFIIPYPPGIPLLSPGELITEEIINYIRTLIDNKVSILGFSDYGEEMIEIIK
ncbi:aminotransferase class I/II-fold pyridoxal phosphate-dependent enzyme [Dethiothermospora halolimnae]|uniref:aminotransferase class I/II-fold pyridoxal phosphate-dependent enzyme n=1 Tax=Dethiothermospora halolimnae TaxID=3114390 RepID=UPI003CCC3AF1